MLELPQKTVGVDHSGTSAFLENGTIYYTSNSSRNVEVPPIDPNFQHVSRLPRKTICIDHSGGHAFLDNGTIYYSPNCSRVVEVPPFDPNFQQYPFHPKTDSVESHMKPQWWQICAGYLSFIPLFPAFDNFIFGCLKDSQILEFNDNVGSPRWKLNVERFAQWQVLEDRLIMAAHRLRNGYIGLPYMSPTPPSMIGFPKVFVMKQSDYLKILRSRDWFIIWIAFLSFLLVQTGDSSQEHWFALLVDQKIEQAWVSGLRDFILSPFKLGSKTQRVGTFLDPFSGDNRQATVEWLCDVGVPVWYRWGPEQEDRVCSSSIFEDLKYLRPPVGLLQNATTHLVKNPSHSSQETGGRVSEDVVSHPIPPQSLSSSNIRPLHSEELLYQARDAHIKTKPWEGFFAARKAANEEYYRRETTQQRQTRLSRERIPPRVSAEVFLWDWNVDDPLRLVRSRVLKRERDEVLSNGKYAHFYDAVRNQWDVCKYFDFGTLPDEDEESDDELDKGFDGMEPLGHPIEDEGIALSGKPILPEQEVNSYISNRLQSYSSTQPPLIPTIEPQNEIIDESFTFSLTEYLLLHFGYTLPLPLPPKSDVDNTQWKLLLKNTGLRTDRDTDRPPLDSGKSILEFLHSLLLRSPNGPPADSWDLNPSNRCPILPKKLLDTIPRKSKDVFIVDSRFFAIEPQFEWTIAVFNPADAVKVYRLLQHHDLTPLLLARYLLRDGIAFRTLLPRSDPLSSTLVSCPLLPMRIRDHRFTLIDYEVYVQQRAKILASPRGRAALLMGGIVARLAREHIDIDVAALGPSTAVTTHNIGLHLTTSDGHVYMDDLLTKEEVDIICGLHRCQTGHGSQEALLSWWPLPQTWCTDSNGHYWGYWTEIDEQWFQKRQRRILEGLEQPMRPNAWRDALRGAKSWRVTVGRLEQEAAALYPEEAH